MASTNDKVVHLVFDEPISDNRYKTELLTPEMLEAAAQWLYGNPRLTERISELVDLAIEQLFPELERETDENGLSKVKVVLYINNALTRNSYTEEITVMAEDFDDAEDKALWQFKYNNSWHDDDGAIIVQSVEWAE